MNATHPAPGHRRASLRAVSLGVLTLLLAACAQVPDLGPKASLADAEQIAQQTAFDGGQALWPNQPWWARYGDAQLNAIVEEALHDAPSMTIALARLKQAAAIADQQGANLKPTVQANVSASSQRQSYNNGIPAAFVPQGWNDYGRATLELSYDLDWWGRNHAALAAATSNWQAAQAEAAQAHVTLSANLVQAYADLARLYAQLDTADQAVEVRTQTVRLFQERQSNGLETLGGVKQVQARLAQAEGERLALKESLVTQHNLLAALMGRGPDRGQSIQRPTVDLSQVQGMPAQLEVNLIGRRPDLVAARLRAQASARQIDVAEAGFYPNVNISAVIGAQSLGLDMLTKPGSRIGSIGPAISLPLFDQGRLQGQYKQAHAQYEEAVAQYKQAITQALQDVADVANSEQALAGRLTQAQAAVDASRQAWQIARNRYEGGLATYIEVLSAEDSLLSVQRDLTNLQSRLFSLDVSLVRALGGGYQYKAI
jgi:NodT family efflux transporter outer membrane factor (OMF) lipoprotein